MLEVGSWKLEFGKQLPQLIRLIVRERFRRKEVERACLGVSQEVVEHGQIVAQRLAAGRRRDDHDVLLCLKRAPRRELMAIELSNAAPPQRVSQARMQIRWKI